MKDMRKRLFIVLALMVCGFAGAWAGEVTPEQAREIAQKFVKSHGSRRAAPEMEQPVKVSGLYIFNINNNGGYVIVSNDDQTTPILGFSDSGSIDPDNMPSNMRAWLQGYADEIAWLQKNGITTTPATDKARRRSGTQKTNIPILIETRWDQGNPYNRGCPQLSNGDYCATGCVATAMAQAMYYTEIKAGNSSTTTIEQIPGYTTKTYHFSLPAIDAGKTINWGQMKLNYSNGYTSDEATAVAYLMRYCGRSVEMDYGPESSSNTVKVANALKTYFGYHTGTTKYVARSCYTYDNWKELIYHELSELRPVVYGGQSSGGGHEFVCDGYKYENEKDYFHINWGWGGTSDGYFELQSLNPYEQGIGGSSSSDGFHYGQDAVIGIQKIGGTGTTLNVPINNYNLTINNISLSKNTIALGESVDITLNVSNSGTEAYDGDLWLVRGSTAFLGKMFLIPAGTIDQNYVISYTPTDVGSVTLYPSFIKNNGKFYEPPVPDDLSVTLDVVNQTPTGLTASNITQTTADIGWTNVGEATSWNMRSRPATATIEDFNDFSTFNNNSFKEKDWQRIKFIGGISQLRLSDNGGIDNSKCMISPSYENDTDVNPNGGGLRTPKFNLGGFISFYAWGVGEHFQIYISTNGSNYHAISDEISATNEIAQYSFDLTEYAGQEGYIAIIHCNSSGHTSNSFLYIDNVSFAESVGEWTTLNITSSDVTSSYSYSLAGLTQNTCYEVQVQAVNNDGGKWSSPVIFNTLAYPVPENLTVSDVTPTSAKVSWTGSASSYDVRYGPIQTSQSNLCYDEEQLPATSIGTGSTVTWGVMYPQVNGNKLTKVAFYESSQNNTADITVDIYSGGDNGPDKLLHSEVVTPTGNNGFHEITFIPSVTILSGENLWITLTETDSYPIVYCTSTESNNQWIKSGDTWYHIGDLESSFSNYGWMIRAYIESEDVNWSEPVNCTDQPYKLTGLDHTKNYAVQVRGNYGSNGYSDWATVTFDKASGNLELGNNNTNNADLIADWNGFKATSVTLTGRTLYKDGKWNTLCLPFDIDDLTGTIFDESTNCTIKTLESSSINNGELKLNFSGTSLTQIVAGKPYIIKWSKPNDYEGHESAYDIENPTFSANGGVTISNANNDYTDTNVSFCGNYNYQPFGSDNTSILLIGINKLGESVLYYPQSGAKLGACRAYFQLAKDYTAGTSLGQGGSSVRSYVLNFGDDDSATGIIAIGDSQLSTLNSPLSGWYTLDGRKLNGKPTAKGVYVKNGKKIVIK